MSEPMTMARCPRCEALMGWDKTESPNADEVCDDCEKTEGRDMTYREMAHKLVEECEQAKGPTMRATIIARGLAAVAQASEEVYEKLLAARPPLPCTGAGLVPPLYQGMTTGGSTSHDAAPCSICGQVVEVDGFQRTVNHPYRPVQT